MNKTCADHSPQQAAWRAASRVEGRPATLEAPEHLCPACPEHLRGYSPYCTREHRAHGQVQKNAHRSRLPGMQVPGLGAIQPLRERLNISALPALHFFVDRAQNQHGSSGSAEKHTHRSRLPGVQISGLRAIQPLRKCLNIPALPALVFPRSSPAHFTPYHLTWCKHAWDHGNQSNSMLTAAGCLACRFQGWGPSSHSGRA